MERMVFTYGTLQKYSVLQMVPGNHELITDATLRGFRRETDIRLSPNPEGVVEGKILATDSLSSIDNYEGVDSGVYHRVLVPVNDGSRAWLYQFGNNREATENHIENNDVSIKIE